MRSARRGGIQERQERLLAEGRDMWREAYGGHLSDEECDQISRRLLAFYGIEIAAADPALNSHQDLRLGVENSQNPRDLQHRLKGT